MPLLPGQNQHANCFLIMRVAFLSVTISLAFLTGFLPARTQSAGVPAGTSSPTAGPEAGEIAIPRISSLVSGPTLSISDAIVIEGERSDAPVAVFTVTLSTANFQEVSVYYLMVNDAKPVLSAPPPESQRGTLVFASGETVKTLTIPILFTSTEGMESFRLRLSNPTNARIADSEGVGSTPVRYDANRAAIVRGQSELAPAGIKAFSDLLAVSADPQPAILGAADASKGAIVFPDPNTSPTTQKLVTGLPTTAQPHGVSYFGSDNALISDLGGSRVFVVQISTATLLSTINTAPVTYNGTGTIAVAPNLSAALAMGGAANVTSLKVIQAPFNASSTINSVNLTGAILTYQTQGIVFNNAGRAFVYHTAGISVLDPPYTSVAFTIPVTGNSVGGAIAISPDGNRLLTTILSGNQVRIFQAPFSASSTPTLLTVPGGNGLDGIAVTPDGTKAIVVSAFAHQAAAISAPFSSSSTVVALPLPAGVDGFEDVGISADNQLAILTGNSSTDPPVFIRAPFTAGAQSFNVPIQTGGSTARGSGAVRFLPPGLAPGLTISKSAPASVPSGSNLTYTISYRNTGSVNATNAIIRDPLPAGTSFVSATNGGTLLGSTVVFNVGSVIAGTATQTVSFTVKVNSASGGSVSNNNYTIEATGVTPIPGPPVTTSVTVATTFSISGRVTGSNNEGISAVTMTLSGSQTGSTTTDANGNYSLANLPPGGNYTVSPSKAGLLFTPPNQTFNNVTANQTANFTGIASINITGRVTDGSNNGIGGVLVVLSGTLTRVVQTDATGNYSFNNLVGGGNYSVVTSSPLYVFTPPRFDFTNLSANQIANFVQVPNAVPSPTPALVDDFAGGQRDPAKWNLGTATQPAGAFDPQVTVAQTSGQLVITPRSNASGPHYNGYTSVTAFNLNGGTASVEVAKAATGGADTIYSIGSDSNNFFRFKVHTAGLPSGLAPEGKNQNGIVAQVDPTLLLQVVIAGQLTTLDVPYDPVQHHFMRFRHESTQVSPPNGAIVFEAGPDGINFTPLRKTLLERGLDPMTVELSAGTAGSTTTDAAKFDNVKLILSTFQFTAGTYSVVEGEGSLQVTVTREGDRTTAGTVNFATADGTAIQGVKYINKSETLTFAPGEPSKTVTVSIVDNFLADGNQTLNLLLGNATTAGLNSPGRALVTIIDNDTTLTANQVTLRTWIYQGRTYAYLKVSFPNSGFRVANWGQAIRTGNDFTADAAVEKLFGAAVQAETTTAGIYDLGPLADGTYNFNFKTSGALAKTLQFTVSSAPAPPNPIDTAREFVKQQYRDFLNREADPAGENFWTDNITKCSDPARRPAGQTEAQCIVRQRETTSGAFFQSPEFQYTGYFVYRMYQGALGRKPKLSEFTPDAQFVGAGILVNNQLSGAKINQNKADFAAQFANCTDAAKSRCAEFKAIYGGLNDRAYVDKLFLMTGVNASAADRQALVNGLTGPSTETRASVLQKIVDGINVISEGNQQFTTTYGQAFYNSEFNRAFVQLQYFGYLKRDPDDAGYAFWLGKLNQFGGDFIIAQMVLAFIDSPEYRARFGQP